MIQGRRGRILVVLAVIGFIFWLLTIYSPRLPRHSVIPDTDGVWDVNTDVPTGAFFPERETCRWKVTGDNPRAGGGASTVVLRDGDASITVLHCGRWFRAS